MAGDPVESSKPKRASKKPTKKSNDSMTVAQSDAPAVQQSTPAPRCCMQSTPAPAPASTSGSAPASTSGSASVSTVDPPVVQMASAPTAAPVRKRAPKKKAEATESNSGECSKTTSEEVKDVSAPVKPRATRKTKKATPEPVPTQEPVQESPPVKPPRARKTTSTSGEPKKRAAPRKKTPAAVMRGIQLTWDAYTGSNPSQSNREMFKTDYDGVSYLAYRNGDHYNLLGREDNSPLTDDVINRFREMDVGVEEHRA